MNENNQFENQQENNVRFDVENTVSVVSSENADKRKNVLPVIVAAAVLLVAVVCGVVWFFLSNSSNNNLPAVDEVSTDEHVHSHSGDELLEYIESNMEEWLTDAEGQSMSREEYVSKLQSEISEATTTVKEDVGSFNPNTIVEVTTSASDVNETTTAVDKTQIQKAEDSIKLFFDRACYMKGAMYGGSEGNSLVMSMDGNNFEVLTNLDGTEVSILSLDGKLYIKRPATKQYIELTETIMDLIGITPEDFSMNFGTADYETMKKKQSGVYSVSYSGKAALCHEYVNEDQIYKFYTVDGELKEIDICDNTGTPVTQLVLDHFSSSIPGDQLTLKGYTVTSMTVIFADLM